MKSSIIIEEGNVVFAEGVNHRIHDGILEAQIVKVGRKYFEAKIEYHSYKFEKETMRQVSDYSPSYVLYATKEEIEEKNEYNQNVNEIKQFLTHVLNNEQLKQKGLTLEKTREILNIIKQK